MDERIIYRLNDQISFRRCSLAQGKRAGPGNCTNFDDIEENWHKYYICLQNGIHLHCTKHPEMEFDEIREPFASVKLKCPKCNEEIIVCLSKGKCSKRARKQRAEAAPEIDMDNVDGMTVEAEGAGMHTFWCSFGVRNRK